MKNKIVFFMVLITFITIKIFGQVYHNWTVLPPDMSIGITNDTSVIEGNALSLQASGGIAYFWSNGQTSSLITVTPLITTTYYVTIKNNDNCTDIASVVVKVKLFINVSANQTICRGASTSITATGADTYLWSTGDTNATITVNPSVTTTYTITGTKDGISESDEVVIIVTPLPITPIITLKDGNVLESNAIFGNKWHNQNGVIEEAMLQTYKIATNGIYYVIVVENECYSDTSNIISVNNINENPQSFFITEDVSHAWSMFDFYKNNGIEIQKMHSPIFPDTITLLYDKYNNPIRPKSFGIGAVLDINAPNFKNHLFYNINMQNFVLDTVVVEANYIRVNNVVDTLILELIYGTANTNELTNTEFLPIAFSSTPNIYSIFAPRYSNITNSLSGLTKKTYKLFLTNTDTVTKDKENKNLFLKFPIENGNGLSLTRENIVGAYITYKPGNKYVLNDIAMVEPGSDKIQVLNSFSPNFLIPVVNVDENPSNDNILAFFDEYSYGLSYRLYADTYYNLHDTISYNINWNKVLLPELDKAFLISFIISIEKESFINVSANQTICRGASTSISATGADTYLWSTGETSATITVNPTVTTTYTITGTKDGISESDKVVITVDTVVPTANAGQDKTIDVGNSVTLTATGGSTYSWNNGAKTDTITLKPIKTRTYTVTVTVTNIACTATDNVVVTVIAPKIEVTPMRVELFNDNKKSNSIAYHTSSKDYDAKDYDLAVSVIIDTMPLYESRQNRVNLKYASSIDWSSYDTEAKNQGYCGSCWSFTGIALIENISKQVAGQQGIPQTNINLSEQTILSCNNVVSDGCNGGWPIWVYNYARKYGVPNETCLPYKAKDATTIPCNNKCSEPEYNIKVTDVHDYMWGFNMTVSDLREALQEGPISVAMYVPQSFFYYNGGIYKYKGGYYEFGHAVLLVGYDDDLKCFKAKNSWGTSWGENGYFRISYDDVSSAVKFGCFAQRATNPYASNLKPSNTLITIKNIGSGTLNINSIQADKSWLTVGSVSKTSLKTDSSVSFTCTINWNIIADKDSSLISISTNDPETPILKAKIIAYKNQTGNVPGSICVTPPFYQDNILPADTGHFDINILNIGETNISYSITADVDWINILQANATNDATIKVNLSANNTMQERTGLINIVDNNTSSSRSLMVKQGVNVAPKAMDIYKTGEDIVRFAKKDFVDAYTGNSPIQFVRIDELPESGNLLLGNRNVVAFQTISIDSIDNLLYMPEDKDGRFVFRYRASDGSNRSIEQASGIIDIISSIRENIDRDSRFIITIKDDELIIRILDANVKPHAVYVYSIDGRMLMRLDIKNKDNVYNIASLKPGVYLLKITDINDNMLKVQKIVR